MRQFFCQSNFQKTSEKICSRTWFKQDPSFFTLKWNAYSLLRGRYLTGVENFGLCRYRLYPLTPSIDNSIVLDNRREFSQWSITTPDMQKSFQIVDNTAQINFLQKSVTILYYEAQLKYILKSSSNLCQEGRFQNEIYKSGGIVHIICGTITR